MKVNELVELLGAVSEKREIVVRMAEANPVTLIIHGIFIPAGAEEPIEITVVE